MLWGPAKEQSGSITIAIGAICIGLHKLNLRSPQTFIENVVIVLELCAVLW
jgi:hypothetical protein